VLLFFKKINKSKNKKKKIKEKIKKKKRILIGQNCKILMIIYNKILYIKTLFFLVYFHKWIKENINNIKCQF